jgi:hypothetical protein
MIFVCPTVNVATAALVLRTEGASEAACMIESLTKQGLIQYSGPRAQSLVSEIEQLFVESAEAARYDQGGVIDKRTADAAIAFAIALPKSLPAPEIAPEADGEISFDWMGPLGKIFSVSIDATGRLAYAGSFGRKSKVHGTEQLSNTCPAEIIQGISKAVS